MDREEEVRSILRELKALVEQLEKLCPGRHFTLDGHLVGSIGEVVAEQRYDLKLLPSSSETHDAETRDGVGVQVKATQGRSIGLRGEPSHLLVLQIRPDGDIVEVYNGPGAAAWSEAGKPQKNGQRSISLAKLKILKERVPLDKRISLRASHRGS